MALRQSTRVSLWESGPREPDMKRLEEIMGSSRKREASEVRTGCSRKVAQEVMNTEREHSTLTSEIVTDNPSGCLSVSATSSQKLQPPG